MFFFKHRQTKISLGIASDFSANILSKIFSVVSSENLRKIPLEIRVRIFSRSPSEISQELFKRISLKICTGTASKNLFTDSSRNLPGTLSEISAEISTVLPSRYPPSYCAVYFARNLFDISCKDNSKNLSTDSLRILSRISARDKLLKKSLAEMLKFIKFLRSSFFQCVKKFCPKFFQSDLNKSLEKFLQTFMQKFLQTFC